MKDKRLFVSYPILILVGILYLYFYVGNPLEKEFDKGSMAIIFATCVFLTALCFFKREFIRQIIAIILVLTFISIYFLI